MEGTYANGYIYIVGGILDTNNGTSEVRYARVNSDGTLGSWTTAAEAATVYLGGTVTASNGYLYTFGGKDFGGGAVTYNTVHYAKLLNSGETGAWATSTNTFTTARWEHASFMANGYAYILGGASNTAGTTLVSTVRYARLSGVLQVGGDLDLVGIQAGNLANGGIGGSLTANNGMFTGSLNVLGSSIFNQAVSVNGTLNVSDAVAVAGSITGASSATLGTSSTTNGTLTLLNSTNAFGVTISASGQTVGSATIAIPNTSGVADTFCLLTIANCAGSATTLQASYTADADGSDAEILLTAADGAIRIRDAGTTIGDLLIVEANGGTDYLTVTDSEVTVNGDLLVTAGNFLSLTGGNTASRPGSPTEGMVYYDTDTDQLLVYSNGKWLADGREAYLIAANNSSAADKAAADYITDGTSDETEINAALDRADPASVTSGARKSGKVYLFAGTYVADGTILVPNNTTLAGAGRGTVIQLDVGAGTDNLVENSDTTTGTGVTIRDLTLDGSLGTGGTQTGIEFNTVGAGTGSGARQGGRIENVKISEFNGGSGIYLNASLNNIITGVVADLNSGGGIYLGSASNNNTITNNKTQGNGNDGIGIADSEYNLISGNTIEGNTGDGIEVYSSYNNTISGNLIQNNTNNGINLTSNGGWNTVTGNTIKSNNTNIVAAGGSNNNTISGNTLTTSGVNGIYLSSNYNNITGNSIHDSNGSGENNGIFLEVGDYNSIVSNTISDTSCDTTCYAINIFDSDATENYLEGNRYSDTDVDDDADINNAGTGTIYAGQSSGTTTGTSVSNFLFRGTNSATAFAIQNSSGTSVFNVNTSTAGATVDGTFAVTGNTTLTGDLAVNGDDITSDGALTINAASYVRIGDTGTPGVANGDDDLYVEGDIETDGGITVAGNILQAANGYYNFGTTSGSSGYGIRDNGGSIEVKDANGCWQALIAGSCNTIVTPVLESSTTTNGVTSGTTTLTIPSGTENGDLLIASVNTYAATISGPPAGWTLLDSAVDGTGNNTRVSIYYRIASSDTAGTTRAWTHASTFTSGSMVRISGADPASPIHGFTQRDRADDAQIGYSAITTSVSKTLGVGFASSYTTGHGTTGISNWSNVAAYDPDGGSSYWSRIDERDFATATTYAAEETAITETDSYVSYVIAVKPDPSGASVGNANINLSNLANTAVNTDLKPGPTNTYDLGSSTARWQDLYLGTSIDLSNSTSTTGNLANLANSTASQTTATILNVVQSGTSASYTGNVASFTGAFTGSAGNVLNVTSVNTTAGNALSVSANALTTGIAQTISNTGTGLTTAGANTGSLLNIQASGATTAFTGSLASINFAGTAVANTGALLNLNSSGAAQLTQSILATNASTGTSTNGLVRFNFTGVRTTAGSGLRIDDVSTTLATTVQINSNALTTGIAQTISNTGTGLTTAGANTGSLLNIQASGATTAFTGSLASINFAGTAVANTGALLNLNSSGAAQLTQSLLVTNASTGAPANGLVRYNFTGTRTAAGVGLQVDDALTTLATAVRINTNTLTTGNALVVSSTGTGLTTGSLISVTSATTGLVATNGIVSLNATGNYTSTSNVGLLNVTANTTVAGTVANFSGNALTTGVGVNIASTGTGLTTGSLLRVTTGTTSGLDTNGVVSISATGNYTSTVGNAALLNVVANSTASGTVANIQGNALTVGQALGITSTSTGLTTGSLIRLSSATTGALATNGIVSLTATGDYTSTSNVGLLNLTANVTQAGTIANISGTALTTGTALNITATSLTTGAALTLNAGTATAISSGGNIIFQELTGTRTLGVQTRTTNVAGTNLTVQAGSAGTGAGAFAGGALTLQGGAAAGTGNANGGNVVISAGTGIGTGVKGLVVIDTATYNAATVQNFTGNANITQANIDSFGSILISGDVAGRIATLTDPVQTTAGRVVYVTNTGTVDITLAANTVGVALDISLKPASTATMYWNGTDWTAAGASSSTDLQAAYDNTATSAGGAELVLNAAGGAADGLTVRNNSTTPIIGGLLEVQTSIGSNLFTVNNNATEYAKNGGAETADTTAATFPATTWDTTTGGTVDRYQSTTGGFSADNVATGQASVRVQTTTTNHGARNRLSTTLTSGLTYTVSFAVRGATNFATLDIRYSPDGTTAGTTQCATAQTVTSGQWTRITCSFVASGTITSSNSILIRQTDATARTFYIDNLSVNVNASANHAADGSVDDSGAFATNWTNYAASGTATASYESTTIYDTAGSAEIALVTATAGNGIRNNLAITPQISTQYLVSFYVQSTTTMTSSLAVGFLPAGGTGAPSGTAACTDYSTQTLVANTWTKITCLFTTPGSGISNPDLVIYQTDAAIRSIFVDALSITLNTNNSNNVQIGGANKGGPVTLFTLDRSNGAPIAANNEAYLGSMYYDTSTGRIQCYEADGWGACGAAPDNIVNLNPEYAGAVLNGTGVGTMTADFCSNDTALSINSTLCSTGQAKNYYRWTSPQATQQTYSIYVTYQLPSTFNDFASDDTIQLVARTDSTANAAVTYEMFRSTGSAVTQCGTGETSVVTSANTWQQIGINGNEATGSGGCAFAASDFIIFKINMKANSNANAYVSTLSFTTTGR